MAESGVTHKFGRAIMLRCPRCGAAGIRDTWLRMKTRCPTCDLALERGESDYWIGAYVFNLVAAESAAAVVGSLVLWANWPEARAATIAAVASAIALPFLFFPFSRTLWLAWDLSFRPAEPGDETTRPPQP